MSQGYASPEASDAVGDGAGAGPEAAANRQAAGEAARHADAAHLVAKDKALKTLTVAEYETWVLERVEKYLFKRIMTLMSAIGVGGLVIGGTALWKAMDNSVGTATAAAVTQATTDMAKRIEEQATVAVAKATTYGTAIPETVKNIVRAETTDAAIRVHVKDRVTEAVDQEAGPKALRDRVKEALQDPNSTQEIHREVKCEVQRLLREQGVAQLFLANLRTNLKNAVEPERQQKAFELLSQFASVDEIVVDADRVLVDPATRNTVLREMALRMWLADPPRPSLDGAADAIVEGLQSEGPPTPQRQAAYAHALRQIPEARRPGLVAWLRPHASHPMCDTVVSAVAGSSGQIVSPLAGLAEDPDPAIARLGWLGLSQLAQDRPIDVELRRNLVRSLWMIGSRSVEPEFRMPRFDEGSRTRSGPVPLEEHVRRLYAAVAADDVDEIARLRAGAAPYQSHGLDVLYSYAGVDAKRGELRGAFPSPESMISFVSREQDPDDEEPVDRDSGVRNVALVRLLRIDDWEPVLRQTLWPRDAGAEGAAEEVDRLVTLWRQFAECAITAAPERTTAADQILTTVARSRDWTLRAPLVQAATFAARDGSEQAVLELISSVGDAGSPVPRPSSRGTNLEDLLVAACESGDSPDRASRVLRTVAGVLDAAERGHPLARSMMSAATRSQRLSKMLGAGAANPATAIAAGAVERFGSNGPADRLVALDLVSLLLAGGAQSDEDVVTAIENSPQLSDISAHFGPQDEPGLVGRAVKLEAGVRELVPWRGVVSGLARGAESSGSSGVWTCALRGALTEEWFSFDVRPSREYVFSSAGRRVAFTVVDADQRTVLSRGVLEPQAAAVLRGIQGAGPRYLRLGSRGKPGAPQPAGKFEVSVAEREPPRPLKRAESRSAAPLPRVELDRAYRCDCGGVSELWFEFPASPGAAFCVETSMNEAGTSAELALYAGPGDRPVATSSDPRVPSLRWIATDKSAAAVRIGFGIPTAKGSLEIRVTSCGTLELGDAVARSTDEARPTPVAADGKAHSWAGDERGGEGWISVPVVAGVPYLAESSQPIDLGKTDPSEVLRYMVPGPDGRAGSSKALGFRVAWISTKAGSQALHVRRNRDRGVATFRVSELPKARAPKAMDAAPRRDKAPSVDFSSDRAGCLLRIPAGESWIAMPRRSGDRSALLVAVAGAKRLSVTVVRSGDAAADEVAKASVMPGKPAQVTWDWGSAGTFAIRFSNEDAGPCTALLCGGEMVRGLSVADLSSPAGARVVISQLLRVTPWVSAMDSTVGSFGSVLEYDLRDSTVRVALDDGTSYWYPVDAVEVVGQ